MLDIIRRAKQSEETRRLLKKVKKYAMKARANNTFKKYKTPWRRFILWATKRSRRGEYTRVLPADPFDVALFLARQTETHPDATTVVQTTVTAINFVHKFNGMPEPCGHLASALVQGIRRKRSH